MFETSRLERGSKYLFYLCLFILVVILLALVLRVIFQLPPHGIFQVYLIGAKAGLALSGVGLLALVSALFNKSRILMRYGLLSILHGALPALAAIVMIGPSGFRAPMIHDVTTDTGEPPAFIIAKTLRQAGDNGLDYGGEEIAAQQREAFPDLQPIITELGLEAARERCLEAIGELGWTVTGNGDKTGQIEAYETSPLFGFIDDVVIRIRPDGMNTRIDVRSASRAGLGDLGENARRIRRFVYKFRNILHSSEGESECNISI